MIEVHLYGKLRRFADEQDPRAASVVTIEAASTDSILDIAERIGIPASELGANLFLDGRYASPDASVGEATRLGLFPDDMQLLYKWYFRPQGESAVAD